MEAVEPVERAGGEEIRHLAAAEIIDRRVPVGMEAAARIGMLVERPAVEMREAVLVGRKMRRHPVEDDAEAGLVRAVDEAGEAGRIAVAPRRREQADRLVAPGGVERMLGDRQQFEMGEAHVDGIGNELVGEFVIGQEAPAVGPAARSRDAPRRSTSACAADRPGRAPAEERIVVPVEIVGARDDGGGRGPQLAAEAERIGLQRQHDAVRPDDLVFVDRRPRRGRARRSPTGRCRRACASGGGGRPRR